MDIVLVNPPILDRRSVEIPTRAHNPFEHLGLGYIAAYLRKNGYGVRIVDSYIITRSLEKTIDLIEKESPRLVGISATHEFLTAAVEIAGNLRKRGYRGHITMGGYLSTFMHDKLLKEYPQIDSVIRGEGEFALLELAKNLDNPSAWRNIPGISYRENGEITVIPQGVIKELDELPHPSRDTLPDLQTMYDYSAISSSRGCPMNCSFCSIHSFYERSGGSYWRPRSEENVVDEMEKLVNEHGVKQIAFTDDNFLGIPGRGKGRAMKMSKMILARKLKVEFSILCRVNDLDEGLLRFMKMAGLRSLFVGFESGVDRALRTFNKKITAAQNRAALEIIKRVGIRCFPGFIMFDPYTTMDEIKQNLDFVDFAEKDTEFIKIDDLLGSLQPFTGTAIRRRLEKEGRIIFPQDSPLIRMDQIPTYRIADPRVETLRRAMKGIRNSMKRPLFDDFNQLQRRVPVDKWKTFEPFYGRFQKIVQDMRDLEKACFRECMGCIESHPGIKPEEWEEAAEFSKNDIKKLNTRINEMNGEISGKMEEQGISSMEARKSEVKIPTWP